MTWIRIDDQLPIHHKWGLLTTQDQAALLAIWAFCARSHNEGIFTLDQLPRINYHAAGRTHTVTAAQLRRHVAAGLIDPLDDGNRFIVHDWADYQPSDPTAAERKRRQRERDKERDRTQRDIP